jgi:exopolysaccharide biosynthesis polyprenyl glycosylphosphotransferase
MQRSALGSEPPKEREPAFYQRRRKRSPDLTGQILVRLGLLDAAYLRTALRVQEAKGGQIGRILVRMRACSELDIARALSEQVKLRDGTANASLAARENPNIAGLEVPCSPLRTTAALMAADVTALFFGAALGVVANHLRVHAFVLESLLVSLPAVALSLLAFWSLHLYAAMARSVPDELRATTASVTFISLSAGTIAVLAQRGAHLVTVTGIGVWWLVSVAAVPLARAFVRARWAERSWWGHPVVVLGAGKTGRLLTKTLLAQRRCGLRPVMMLDDDPIKHGTLRTKILGDVSDRPATSTSLASSEIEAALCQPLSIPPSRTSGPDLVVESTRPQDALPHVSTSDLAPMLAPASHGTFQNAYPRGMFAEVEGIPVVGDLALAPLLAKRLKIPYAVIAMPSAGSEKMLRITESLGGYFSHILLIPDLFGFATLGVPAKDVGGVLGIEVRQQLLLPMPRFVKRCMDVGFTFLGSLLILPLLVMIALLIKIDSRGPVFYSQTRLGKNRHRFLALKFRTMHGDGEERLKDVLVADPKLRAEYEEFHKLTNDPRVTRVGRLLRRYSLDELPQIWNVLKGDMSLVGPRPYLEREIPDMQQREAIILRATPGVTGLWQVSDRNSTGFGERVKMDVHYVRNWSPWLDIYILARTVGVVLRGTGV